MRMTKLRAWILRKLKQVSLYVAWWWMRNLPHPWDILWCAWVLENRRWFIDVRRSQ
jgi:hypothetical protein